MNSSAPLCGVNSLCTTLEVLMHFWKPMRPYVPLLEGCIPFCTTLESWNRISICILWRVECFYLPLRRVECHHVPLIEDWMSSCTTLEGWIPLCTILEGWMLLWRLWCLYVPLWRVECSWVSLWRCWMPLLFDDLVMSSYIWLLGMKMKLSKRLKDVIVFF